MSTKSDIEAVKDVLEGLEAETPYTFALKYAKDELIRRFNETVKNISIYKDKDNGKMFACVPHPFDISHPMIKAYGDNAQSAVAFVIVEVRKYIFGEDYDEVKLAEIRKEIQNIRIESSVLFRDPTPKKNSGN
jgi:hypothetical protein